jgi:hypothetical protein
MSKKIERQEVKKVEVGRERERQRDRERQTDQKIFVPLVLTISEISPRLQLCEPIHPYSLCSQFMLDSQTHDTSGVCLPDVISPLFPFMCIFQI